MARSGSFLLSPSERERGRIKTKDNTRQKRSEAKANFTDDRREKGAAGARTRTRSGTRSRTRSRKMSRTKTRSRSRTKTRSRLRTRPKRPRTKRGVGQ